MAVVHGGSAGAGGYAPQADAPRAAPQSTELKFVPFAAAPDISFWQELMRRKLDVLRLDASPIPVRGYYEAAAPREAAPASVASEKCFFGRESYDDPPTGLPPGAAWVQGELLNFNTAEEFRTYIKSEARSQRVAAASDALRDDIVGGAALEDPVRLRPLLAVAFADLKTYLFSYTLAFPVLAPSVPWSLRETPCSAEQPTLGFGREQLCEVARHLRDDTKLASAGMFVLVRASSGAPWEVQPLSAFPATKANVEKARDGPAAEGATSGAEDDLIVGFVDPSTSEGAFGWPLRNLLLVVAHHRPGTRRFLAFRDLHLNSRSADAPVRSRLFVVEANRALVEPVLVSPPPATARFAGWSRINSVDLKAFLDSRRMAADAVDLNVKLMKWRLLPDLEPGRLRDMRFLLLGAGTLGCSMARVLMGWGVRRMTFLDSGKVGLSNPVRQSLFTHQDAASGRSKAEAAKCAVEAVMPDAEVEAVEMEIPMPGHPHQSPEVLEGLVQKLKDLVGSHDVVCMLTDSRESRWLPSLLVSASQLNSTEAEQHALPVGGHGTGGGRPPLGITVALGFDSFLVGRQSYCGAPSACYFCNDLTAPSDSLAFRTLDQQCTVTRPGLSSLAAGVAAELVAGLTQHELGFAAPCSLATAGGTSAAVGAAAGGLSLLGAVPHQVRGYLADFRLAPAETEPFKNCICCSAPVLGAYAAEGAGFVRRVIANSADLEDISGLAAMKRAVCDEDVLSFDGFDDEEP